MVVGFDLNDVIRAFTKQFGKYYNKEFDRGFDYEDYEPESIEEYCGFNFQNKKSFERFLYEDYPLEIFGHAQTCDKNLMRELNSWLIELTNLDENNIHPVILSTKEFSLSIQSTYYFLSKIGCKIREIYLGKKFNDVWDKCDVIITANPEILKNKPENKISIKIEKKYNKEIISDYTFNTLIDLLQDNEIVKILNK